MQYSIKDKRLILQDEEIGIDHHLSFDLPSFTDNEGFVEKGENRWFEKDGLWHGEYQILYPNHRLKSCAFYHEGRLHGPSKWYSDKGVLLSICWYLYGKKEGKAFRYYPSSALYAKEQWKDGKMHMEQRYYYEDGSCRSSFMYNMGELDGKVVMYHPNGQIKRECFLQKGKKEGWERLYTENGALLDEGEYLRGKPIGEHRRWHSNGNMAEKAMYFEDGRWEKETWDEEGLLLLEEKALQTGEYIQRKRGSDGSLSEKKGSLRS